MRWLVLCLFLSGCGVMSWLPFGGSSGTSVNSNAQIGAENTQAVVSIDETTSVGRDMVTKEIETGMVEKLNIQNIPPWVILLLILGWLLPTPTEMGRGMVNFVLLLFGRQKL